MSVYLWNVYKDKYLEVNKVSLILFYNYRKWYLYLTSKLINSFKIIQILNFKHFNLLI